jgi:hypothetical protein
MNGRNWQQSGLVAGYHLEDVNDFSGGAKNLNNNGSVTFNTTKYENGAILGNANNSKWLSRSDGLSVDLSGNCGYSAWIYLQTNPGSGYEFRFVDWRSTAGTGRYLTGGYKNDGGTYKLGIWPGTASFYGVAYTLTLDKWYKVDVSCESGGSAYLYCNGVLIGSTARGTQSNATNALTIGAEIAGTANYFWKGNIDEVAFFNRHRTISEIKRTYLKDIGI